jgi:septum formation protein
MRPGGVPPAPGRDQGALQAALREDIEAYLASGEWRGKAGGYAAQGIAGAFMVKIVGSYSNIVGRPLYETTTLLAGEGFPIRLGWLNAV